ncbi:unnamed protein product [Parajaminaea phylloscopi]
MRTASRQAPTRIEPGPESGHASRPNDEGPLSQASATASSFGEDDTGFLDALASIPLSQGDEAARRPGQHLADAATDGGITTEPAKPPASHTSQRLDDIALDPYLDLGEMTQWKIADALAPAPAPAPWPHSTPDVEGAMRIRKRARFASPATGNAEQEGEQAASSTVQCDSATAGDTGQTYLNSSTYDALRFGDFSTYMRNKRAKLKVQEKSLQEQEAALLAAASASAGDVGVDGASAGHNDKTTQHVYPPIFAGCTTYITGHTQPPYQELRRLIVLHGGNFMAYMDQKRPVTHIIASNLTPKKREEFRAYKVVRPSWITDSITAGRKLPWQDYRIEADAGGAIGSDRLPVNWHTSVGQRPGEPAETVPLLTPDTRQNQPTSYLANATPWGRAVAQKKLSAFRKQHSGAREADVDKAATSVTDAEPPSGQLCKDNATLNPETVRTCALAAKPSVVDASSDASELARQQSAAPTSPSKVDLPTPTGVPPSSCTTASQEEWLANLETPPRPSKVQHLPQQAGSAKDEASVGTDASNKSAAKAAGYFKRDHPYAKRPSNVEAARLLASPSWRERHTATSESFLAGYFAKSRLHYLSTWKGELKDLVSQALKDSGREQGSPNLAKGAQRVIMHVDFDSFFVSVGLRHRPDLKDKPVVVCHAGADEHASRYAGSTSSTSEIASCNYAARKYGVQNGWSLGRARQLCPHVQAIPYDFEGYKDVSIQFYTLLLAFADAIEAVSVDEALIDVSHLVRSLDPDNQGGDGDRASRLDDDDLQALLRTVRDNAPERGQAQTEEQQLAEAIRDAIRDKTGCEASIGIGANVLQARLATRRAKPGGSFHLQADGLDAFLDVLDLDDLQGVGYSTKQRFEAAFGTANIGELKKKASSARFSAELGPNLGRQVWDKMHGVDRSELEGAKQRQSVGAAVNYAIRFQTQEEAERFVKNLATEVATRLATYQLKARQVNVTLMVRDPTAPVEAPKFLGHGICDVHNRSCPISGPAGIATHEADAVFRGAWKLIKALAVDACEMRGIGISCTKLEPSTGISPVKPSAGQSLLNFSRKAQPTDVATVTPLRLAMRADIAQERGDGEDQDFDQDLGPLTPGPAAQRRQVAIGVHDTTAGPSRTSVSVSSAADASRARSAEPLSEDNRSNSVPPATSVPAPDRRPGLPLRRSARGKPKAIDIALPTMSQMDQSVLSELPAAIRDEIVRESRRLGSRTSVLDRKRGTGSGLVASERGAQDVTDATASAAVAGMSRSFSASPTRRQAFANAKRDSPSAHQRLLQFPIRTGSHPPKSEKPAIYTLDPARVTTAELRSLDIDPHVFTALPPSVQKETLLVQSRLAKGREARFIGGHHGIERTLAEERQLEADKARDALDAEPECLVAADLSDTGSRGPPPSIQKRSTVEDVSELLRKWVSRHATQPPRRNDVTRFSAFMTATAGLQSGLEKVDMLLKTWDVLVAALGRATEDEAQAKDGWLQAYSQVRDAVDEVTRRRWGGKLSR